MDSTRQIKIKYLSNLAVRFSVMCSGVKLNSEKWKTFKISPEVIEEHIKKIIDTGEEIEDLKKLLSLKLSDARKLKEEKKSILEQLEKRAVGIHADEENKLKDYGLQASRNFRKMK